MAFNLRSNAPIHHLHLTVISLAFITIFLKVNTQLKDLLVDTATKESKSLRSLSTELEQKCLELEIANANANARHETVLNNSPTMIYECLVNKSWTMTYISPYIEKLTGYRPDEFIDDKVRSFASIIHADDIARVEMSRKDRGPF